MSVEDLRARFGLPRGASSAALERALRQMRDGDDDPTCAEHALVNILEEGRKAMDAILREMMEITEEQAAGDASKIKAMRTCVGWFSSPACALIYQARRPAATPVALQARRSRRRLLT